MKPSVEMLGLTVHPYVLCLLLGAALSLALLWALCPREGLPRRAMPWVALFAVPLCIICARLFYFLVNVAFLLPMYGWGYLLSPDLRGFAISGAVLGGLLAALCAARVLRQPVGRLLDAMAAPGALMIAIARFGEYFTGIGEGRYIESEALRFFPLAVVNEYGEWYAAIFMFEGVVALLLCALLLRWRLPRMGDRGLLLLLLWALPQILLESQRADVIRWGFVRVQQVFCAVLALAVFLCYALRSRRGGAPPGRLLRKGLLFLGCIGVCVAVEFALDKSNIPPLVSYGAMALALCSMGALTLTEVYAKDT